MATYYKKIKGKNYDKKLIDSAESSVKGKGDGRISLNDAKKILKSVKDSHVYSDIEKSTMKYVRDNYAFTPEANRWFRGEVRKWAATRGAAGKTAKKPARSRTISKQKVPKPAITKPRTEQYESNMVSTGHKAPESHKPERSNGPFRRIILFIIIILVLAFFIMMVTPSSRECIQNRISRIITPAEQKNIPEIKTPAKEPQQDISIEQKKAPEKPEDNGQYYTVQVKDDLISISEKELGNYSKWVDLYNANKDIIKNPTMIFPGQKLKIPAAKESKN